MTYSEPFTVGVENRYFEDYISGSVHEFGPITVEEEEIIAFAKRTIHRSSTPTRRQRRETFTGG